MTSLFVCSFVFLLLKLYNRTMSAKSQKELKSAAFDLRTIMPKRCLLSHRSGEIPSTHTAAIDLNGRVFLQDYGIARYKSRFNVVPVGK